MSDTPYTIPERITIESSVLIELLATANAMRDAGSTMIAFASFGGTTPSDSALDEISISDLQDRIFGPPSSHGAEDEEHSPVEVAVQARAAEISATILEMHVRLGSEAHPMLDRARRLRENGRDMAKAGTIGVMFPGESS